MRGRITLLVLLLLLPAAFGGMSKKIHQRTDKLSKMAAKLRNRETTVDPFDETGMLNRSEHWFNNLKSKQPRIMLKYVAKMGKIALYLRLFKRFGRNPLSNERRFAHQFPTVRQLDKAVQKACVESVDKCVDFIYSEISSRSYLFTSNSLSQNSSQNGPMLTEEAYALLANSDASFAFDTTAAYFMCWMTKMRLPLFRHPPFCSYPDQSITWPELYGLDPGRYPSFIDANYVLIDKLDPVPWRCAEISFCPDPCCGRANIFASKSTCSPGPQSCATDEGVAAAAEMADCDAPLNSNSDLRAIIANEWNVSCACARAGFVYSFENKMCVDHDECSEQPSPCKEQKQCVNVVGSYLCVCELGFEGVDDRCRPIAVDIGSVVWYGPAAVDGACDRHPSARLLVCALSVLFVVLRRG